MPQLDKLLAYLKSKGLSVVYRGPGKLSLTGPPEAKTADIMAAVKVFKPDLLRLYEPDPEQCKTCRMIVYRPREVRAICDHYLTCPYGATE